MRDDYRKHSDGSGTAFAVLQSKGAGGQQRIEAWPDATWEWTGAGDAPILKKAGYLLVSMGHCSESARLTAVASDERYVGQGWMPAPELTPGQAKAAAVFLNSTAGRLLIGSRPGKKLSFPFYNPAAWNEIWMPDLLNRSVLDALTACWQMTRHETVPQFRDGYTPVRRRWDEAVCEALGWDIGEIVQLGELLAREPRVRGVAYGRWKA